MRALIVDFENRIARGLRNIAQANTSWDLVVLEECGDTLRKVQQHETSPHEESITLTDEQTESLLREATVVVDFRTLPNGPRPSGPKPGGDSAPNRGLSALIDAAARSGQVSVVAVRDQNHPAPECRSASYPSPGLDPEADSAEPFCEWRVPEPFGPHCRHFGRLADIIRHRLQGIPLHATDSELELLYTDDLAMDLLKLLTNFESVGSLPSAYRSSGSTMPLEILSRLVAVALPTCYGGVAYAAKKGEPANDSDRADDWYTSAEWDDYTVREEALAETVVEMRPQVAHTARQIIATCASWRWLYRPSDDSVSESSQTAGRGGSIAQVARDDNAGTITKTVSGEGFEGGGRAKLLAEIKFYQQLAQPRWHQLAKSYPAMLGYDANETKPSLTLEYFGDGSSLGHRLALGQPVDSVQLETLIREAFLASYLREPELFGKNLSESFLHGAYLERARSRLKAAVHFLRQDERPSARAAGSLFDSGGAIVIDDKPYRNPFLLLELIEADQRTLDLLRPRLFGPCAHGDMTVLNMISSSSVNRAKLVDPRGTLANWDPAYDLGKFSFSVMGYAHLVCGTTGFLADSSGFHSFTKVPAESPDTQENPNSSWVSALISGSSWIEPIRQSEPGLDLRVQFVESVHYLADSPYRYALARDIDRCISVILAGTVRLNEFMTNAAV
ncbi:hypothetical protein AB5J62_24975 [Amycolatopsis sp. cg5]|uniref:hypothetical protein n=1 Tax=Amycolatopsis sp. cg5 TaxID=3238802 RepID=UPI003526000E